jgi:hypothetical protein
MRVLVLGGILGFVMYMPVLLANTFVLPKVQALEDQYRSFDSYSTRIAEDTLR